MIRMHLALAVAVPWLLAGAFALSGPARAAAPPSLVPLPAHVEQRDGAHVVTASTTLHHAGAGAEATTRYFSDLLARTLDLPLAPVRDAGGTSGITFVLETPQPGASPEGYRLDIDPRRIMVRAGDARGLFYGAVTLWQLLADADRTDGGFAIPAMRIDDAPRFGWRGYMLDSARHFHAVDDVKRMIDAMALHKLNIFHWHLTDDQGWRVEIRRYPRLAEVGGCRIPAGDAGVDPQTGEPRPYCGFYTQDEIRDIVAYAAARHVTVVPEIDVPGHATAAIAAYPELGVEAAPMPVSGHRGIHSNLFNVEEATFAFLDDVFAEVTGLFPSPWIHIGADEAVKDQWRASPRVQSRMRELGLADESALQGWFVQRLERMLHARGRTLVGWDEILEGGLPPRATVMSWRGTGGGIEAARQGHDVVMSPVSSMYLDYLQTASPDEPAGRPKLNTLETFYRFEPVPAGLDPAQQQHILGLQANMWTGDTRGFAGVEHNTFPRLAAVAETGWTPAERRDYAGFLQRLPAHLHRYRLLGIGYARTPFEVLADAALLPPSGDSAQGDATVALSNPLGYPIRYSLDADGTQAPWLEYRQPLRIRLPATLRAAAFADGAALSPVQAFDFTRAGLLQRTDEQLALCTTDGPVLRMEDDGLADGPRALFNVAILVPCWSWARAPLDGIAIIEVRAGRLPYAIHLGAEDAQRRYLPAQAAHGELDIRIDGCDGPPFASAPLPAAPDADGFATVRALLPAPARGFRDLCIRFSGDTRPSMWVLDRIALLPALQE